MAEKTTKQKAVEKLVENKNIVSSDKLKAVQAAMSKLQKEHGKGAVNFMGEQDWGNIERISSGSIGIDLTLSGGFPKGRIIEIYGPEASGKSSLALMAVAEAQKNGGICAYIDAEHAFNPTFAQKLGVNVDNLIISQPDYGEQGLELADGLIQSGGIAIIVIDSVAALVPKAELEGEMGDSNMGKHARLMSQALRKLTASINKTGTVCIFINQLRDKIGVMFGCFPYYETVTLADGTTAFIGDIVESKKEVEVLSHNLENGLIEPRKVVDWYKNGKSLSENNLIKNQELQDWLQLNTNTSTLICTPNHLILTPKGYIAARELEIDDLIAIKNKDNQISFEVLELVHDYKLLGINQNKYNLEVEGNSNYFVSDVCVHNSPETTTGGNALKFYASVRIDVRKLTLIKEGDEIIGHRTKIKVVKNKVGPPFRIAEYDFYHNGGISKEGELIDYAEKFALIERSGAWYSMNGQKIGQGRPNTINFLKENQSIREDLFKAVSEKIALGKINADAEDPSDEELRESQIDKIRE